MKKILLIITCIFLLLKIKAQSYEGALSIRLNKEAVPSFIDFDGGFHSIFIDREKLSYYRINNNFVVEANGEVALSNLGIKPEIFELWGNRKEIFIAYKKLDSVGLRCLAINTINGKFKRSLLIPNWDNSTEMLQHFAIADTLHLLYGYTENTLVYTIFQRNKKLKTSSYTTENDVLKKINEANAKEPQLRKSLVDQSQLGNENKLPIAKVKCYLNHRYLYLTVEGGFCTYILQIHRKLYVLEQQRVDFVLENTMPLKGAIFNSYLRGKYLHQAILTKDNCLVQRYNLIFKKTDYTQSINYQYSTQTQSVVHFLNRGTNGSFESTKERNFVLHSDKPSKYLALRVYKKGPFDHYEISEVEPIETLGNWIQKACNINVENAYRKEGRINVYYALQWQNSAQFAFLYHIQCMSSTLCLSLNQNGEISPFLGNESHPLAKSSSYYYQFLQRGIVPYQATMSQLNGSAYYSFYRRGSREYYFIKL